jgi:site-specific recombinase XerD
MATVKFFLYSSTKGRLAPIHVRLSAGRGIDIIEKTGKIIDSMYWNPAKKKRPAAIKQIVYNGDEEGIKLKKEHQSIKDYLRELETFIERELNKTHDSLSKEWLKEVVYRFENKKSSNAETLNDFIARFIADADSGERMNKDAKKLSPGTVKAWKGFQRNFNEYQGIYTEKRIKWHKEQEKQLRKVKRLDFDAINIDFYHSFIKYLSDEGYGRGTIGRHIKELKMFMKKSLESDPPLHSNRQFEYSAFKGMTNDKSFSIYLTKSEQDKIFNLDLSDNPELDKARDAFLTLCETGLRISDYSQVDVNIRPDEAGHKFIYLNQRKTGGSVIIPLSIRLESILKKYEGTLPRLPEQYINKRIKIIAQKAGFDEVLRWETEKYGKTFERKAFKYQLISNHTGRRSALTNWYLDGIDVISIMMISGHKTESSFMHYIKITKEQNAKKLALHPSFNRLSIAK